MIKVQRVEVLLVRVLYEDHPDFEDELVPLSGDKLDEWIREEASNLNFVVQKNVIEKWPEERLDNYLLEREEGNPK